MNKQNRANKLNRTLALMLVVVLGLSGCVGSNVDSSDELSGMSKEELVEYAHGLEDNIVESNQTIDELNGKLKGVQGEVQKETAGITEFSDGSGKYTMNSVDDMVSLPVPFEYPASVQSSNTSDVGISDSINFKPSPNWVVRLSGSQVEVYHKNEKISGVIKCGNRDKSQDAVLPGDLEGVINEFFNNMPQTELSISRVYIDKDFMGCDAQASTFIDEEDSRIRCGLVGFGDINLSYFFCYNGEQDSNKDDLILTLLQTIKIYGKEMRVE